MKSYLINNILLLITILTMSCVKKESSTVIDNSADLESPSVKTIYPENNTIISDTVKIQVVAYDNVGVDSVKCYINDIEIGTALKAPYSFLWNPTYNIGDTNIVIVCKAIDRSGNISVSDPVHVIIGKSILLPQIIYPQANKIFHTDSVRFIWKKIFTAIQYELQISKEREFVALYNIVNIFDTTYALWNFLPGNYSWCFRGVNSRTQRSVWSNSGLFSIDSTANYINPVELTLPEIGTKITKPIIQLNWYSIANVSGYDIEIATVDNFSVLCKSVSTTKNYYTIDDLNSIGKYYWRVRGNNNLGFRGVWSSISYFDYSPKKIEWIDYYANPVLEMSTQDIDSSAIGIIDPTIIFDNGVYKMWFTVTKPDYGFGYATSLDGINWTRYSKQIVFSKGGTGQYDGKSISNPRVIKDGNIYRLYYSGLDNWGNPRRIFMATSSDGIVWNRFFDFILESSPSISWENRGVYPGDIVKTDSGYYMYYCGINFNGITEIGLATSSNGINWNKYVNNPVLSNTNYWEGQGGVSHPSVIFDEGLFKLVYMGRSTFQDQKGFGIASSIDGKLWTKDKDNPFFKYNMIANQWASVDFAYPCYRKINGKENIFYSGYVINGKVEWGIGLLKGQ